MDMVILVNQDKYKKLPSDLKETLKRFTMQYERDATAWYKQGIAKERKKYEDAGCTYIKLSPQEAKYLSETAEKEAWEKDVQPLVSREVYNEVRKILMK